MTQTILQPVARVLLPVTGRVANSALSASCRPASAFTAISVMLLVISSACISASRPTWKRSVASMGDKSSAAPRVR
ncbi:MAG: hypothetical protein KJ011_15915 [Burkholderiaceae bacterium]|nr:hypothetical protein [Burkholderiaceae bacterium]